MQLTSAGAVEPGPPPDFQPVTAFEQLVARLPTASALPPPLGELELLAASGPPSIPDTHAYCLYQNPSDGRVWVMQHGGIAGDARWFGPAPLHDPIVQSMLDGLPRARQDRPSPVSVSPLDRNHARSP